ARELTREHPGLPFRIGFHASPSLQQMHMHVISQDLLGSNMKHKKHWNSFISPFFQDAESILAQLCSEGQVTVADYAVAEGWLKADLRCHRCEGNFKNMPTLKAHVTVCKAPLKALDTANQLH
ncbi:hypothetical protein CYMTET_32995, partial [Cymbomonas tetramitiformis]